MRIGQKMLKQHNAKIAEEMPADRIIHQNAYNQIKTQMNIKNDQRISSCARSMLPAAENIGYQRYPGDGDCFDHDLPIRQ